MAKIKRLLGEIDRKQRRLNRIGRATLSLVRRGLLGPTGGLTPAKTAREIKRRADLARRLYQIRVQSNQLREKRKKRRSEQ